MNPEEDYGGLGSSRINEQNLMDWFIGKRITSEKLDAD